MEGPVSVANARALKRAMCEKKFCFENRSHARKAAMAMRRDSSDPRRHLLGPYPCPFCDYWHVGHQPTMEHVKLLARFLRWGVRDEGSMAQTG